MSDITEITQKLDALQYPQLVALEKKMQADGTLPAPNSRNSKAKKAIMQRILSNVKKQRAHVVPIVIPYPPKAPEVPEKPRLPKVVSVPSENDDDDEDLDTLVQKYIRTYTRPQAAAAKKLFTGDVVFPENGYRGEAVRIVGKPFVDKEGKQKFAMEYPIPFSNGDIMLPPWVFEEGLQRGFSMEQLKDVYEQGPFAVLIYPYHIQKQRNALKYNKQGKITSLLTAWGPDLGVGDELFDKDHAYFNDLDGPLMMSDLFPGRPLTNEGGNKKRVTKK